jgi:hypothetical protein
MKTLRVVVLGASGELGARVQRLVGGVAGVDAIGTSRSGSGGAGAPLERADVADAASVARLLRAGDLVVNCVGPYRYDAAPLVAACVAARAHYCDLADDVAFAERVRAAARSAAAQAAGVLVCTGASSLPGLAAVLAGALALSPRHAEIARVRAYLSVGSRNPISAGLLASLLAPLGRPLPEGEGEGARCFAELRALRVSDGRVLRFGAYPAAFAGGVVHVGGRALPVRFAFGFDRAALTALLHVAAPLLARLPAAAIVRIAPALLPFARVARVLGTERGVLLVVGEDSAGGELARIELAAGARGLDVPAAPPAWIAARLARDGAPPPAGAVELPALVSIADVVSWVRERGELTLRASEGIALADGEAARGTCATAAAPQV